MKAAKDTSRQISAASPDAHALTSGHGLMPLAAGLVLAVAAIALAGVMAGKWSFSQIMRDPSVEFGFPIYGGFVSELGIAGWIVAATATGVAAAARPSWRHVLLPASLISIMLGLDDQFTLHENVLPRLGLPEMLVYLIYLLGCLYAIRPFLPGLLRFRPPLLAIALTALATSLIIDKVADFDPGIMLFVEDIAKFTGIVFWATFWSSYSVATLRAPSAAPGGIA